MSSFTGWSNKFYLFWWSFFIYFYVSRLQLTVIYMIYDKSITIWLWMTNSLINNLYFFKMMLNIINTIFLISANIYFAILLLIIMAIHNWIFFLNIFTISANFNFKILFFSLTSIFLFCFCLSKLFHFYAQCFLSSYITQA